MNNKNFCTCILDMNKISNAIRCLPEKEADIFISLYGLNGKCKVSVQELARKYDCSKEDILHIRGGVIKFLRLQIKSIHLHEKVVKCDSCLHGKWLVPSPRGEYLLMEDLLSS